MIRTKFFGNLMTCFITEKEKQLTRALNKMINY